MDFKNNTVSILFLGKKNDLYCKRAFEFLLKNFEKVDVYLGEWGDKFPDRAKLWDGDYIISYLSRWIIPESLIGKSKIAAINFHPASPDYPGIGCNNFALYENAKEYGVTCHHMARKVDTGEIISVKRFPIYQTDDVSSLLSRTYDMQIVQFYEIIELIINGCSLPVSQEKWTRPPFTREEFNKLFFITPNMMDEEVKRRVRATNFGIWRPSVKIGGFVFDLAKNNKD